MWRVLQCVYKRPDGGDKESGVRLFSEMHSDRINRQQVQIEVQELGWTHEDFPVGRWLYVGGVVKVVKKDYGISILEDIQNSSRHSSEQPTIAELDKTNFHKMPSTVMLWNTKFILSNVLSWIRIINCSWWMWVLLLNSAKDNGGIFPSRVKMFKKKGA